MLCIKKDITICQKSMAIKSDYIKRTTQIFYITMFTTLFGTAYTVRTLF